LLTGTTGRYSKVHHRGFDHNLTLTATTAVNQLSARVDYLDGSCEKPHRVLSKVEWRPGELLLRVEFIVTNLPFVPAQVRTFYNRHGTAERDIKRASSLSSGPGRRSE
jgi:hypothetical protein